MFLNPAQSDRYYSSQCYRLGCGSWVPDSTLPAARTAAWITFPPATATALVVAGWVDHARSPQTHVYDGTSWSWGPETPTAGRVAHCQAGKQTYLFPVSNHLVLDHYAGAAWRLDGGSWRLLHLRRCNLLRGEAGGRRVDRPAQSPAGPLRPRLRCPPGRNPCFWRVSRFGPQPTR